jgi:hypothetical protein
MLTFSPVGWITPGWRFHGAAKGSLNGQLNRDDVAHDIDPVKLAVNVGKHLCKGNHDVF